MIALLLASALAWALGTVYAQRRAAYIPPRDLAGMQLICGGAGLLVLSWLSGEWSNFDPQQVTLLSLAGLLYLALLGSVIGNTKDAPYLNGLLKKGSSAASAKQLDNFA